MLSFLLARAPVVSRRRVALALVLAALAAFARTPMRAGAQAAAVTHSAPGQVLVVTANLREAFDDADLRRMGEMKIFVRRLLSKVPHLPDALLLQEVRRKSAVHVARLLGRNSADSYVVAQRLAELPYRKRSGQRWYSTDTAVVLNRDTMRFSGHGGFATTPDPWGVKVEWREFKRHAYIRATERDGGASWSFMSLHLPRYGSRPWPRAVAKRYGAWAHELAAGMKRRHPNSTRVMGGDFNQTRCFEFPPCSYSPFWSKLTREFGYRESLYSFNQTVERGRIELGVDFVFTTGRSLLAGYDEAKPRYSDHRFYWALVGD